MVDAILDLLAKGINSAGAQITEGLDVLLGGHHNAYPDGLRDRFRNSGGRSMKTGPRDRSPHTLGQLLWQKLQPPSDWHMGHEFHVAHVHMGGQVHRPPHGFGDVFRGQGIQVFVSGSEVFRSPLKRTARNRCADGLA